MEFSLFLWNFKLLCTCSLTTGLTNNLILFVVNEQTKRVPRRFINSSVINCRAGVTLNMSLHFRVFSEKFNPPVKGTLTYMFVFI